MLLGDGHRCFLEDGLTTGLTGPMSEDYKPGGARGGGVAAWCPPSSPQGELVAHEVLGLERNRDVQHDPNLADVGQPHR